MHVARLACIRLHAQPPQNEAKGINISKDYPNNSKSQNNTQTMGLKYYWKLFRKSWTFSFWGRHVTVGFWMNIITDRVIEERGPSLDVSPSSSAEMLDG
jgi:hypothetical protein